jgi:hypothetical protein
MKAGSLDAASSCRRKEPRLLAYDSLLTTSASTDGFRSLGRAGRVLVRVGDAFPASAQSACANSAKVPFELECFLYFGDVFLVIFHHGLFELTIKRCAG